MQEDPHGARWGGPSVLWPLRITMGFLLGAEAVLAGFMTILVGEVTSDASLFPSPTRYGISSVGFLAGTSLAAYCAVLGFATLRGGGKLTARQQRLRLKARLVHVAVGLVASVVYAWTFWSVEAGILGTSTLMTLALVWSQLINWILAPRPHELQPARPA